MREKIECVYILEAIGLNRIKIGFTTDLIKRLKTIKTSCPATIRLCAIFRGDRELERAYHDEYAKFRVCGEWFECDHETAVGFAQYSDDGLLEEIKSAWRAERKERHDRQVFEALSNIFVEMCQ